MKPKINKILYATDLSDSARHAFGYALDLAGKYNAHITILYVMENLHYAAEVEVSEIVGAKKWKELKQERQKFVAEKIHGRVDDFCREVTEAHDAYKNMGDDICIEKGLPHQVILESSRKMEADLIVMGTHGYNILKDAFMGGTARNVLRKSKIPVLVIRLPEA